MPQGNDKKDSTDIRMKGFKEKKDVVDFLIGNPLASNEVSQICV